MTHLESTEQKPIYTYTVYIILLSMSFDYWEVFYSEESALAFQQAAEYQDGAVAVVMKKEWKV